MEDEESFSQPKAKRLCKCGLCFPEMSWEHGLAVPVAPELLCPPAEKQSPGIPTACSGPGKSFLENKPLAAGEARRAGEPTNNLCFCSGRRCSLGWDILLWGTVCCSLLLSCFCHPSLPPLFKIYFSFKAFFFLVWSSHWRTSGKGSQMEKTELSVFSVPQFLHVCMYSL